ncbi:hypothetical protein Tco_0878897 [Tanacetum coccineum]|uniref:Uncharacterized protein n=1 Tax=Tanacetum coccineum TaxID=301880 RepID=A0ABQ5C2L5_9ASTR
MSENIEALENVVEDKPHFLTEVIDNHLKDVVALGEEVVPWWEEASYLAKGSIVSNEGCGDGRLKVEMVPVAEKLRVEELFWECLGDDLVRFLVRMEPAFVNEGNRLSVVDIKQWCLEEVKAMQRDV